MPEYGAVHKREVEVLLHCYLLPQLAPDSR